MQHSISIMLQHSISMKFQHSISKSSNTVFLKVPIRYFYKVATPYFYNVAKRTQVNPRPLPPLSLPLSQLADRPSQLKVSLPSYLLSFDPFYRAKIPVKYFSTHFTQSIYVQLNFIEYWDHFHGVLTESYFCPKLYLTK